MREFEVKDIHDSISLTIKESEGHYSFAIDSEIDATSVDLGRKELQLIFEHLKEMLSYPQTFEEWRTEAFKQAAKRYKIPIWQQLFEEDQLYTLYRDRTSINEFIELLDNEFLNIKK